MGEVLIGGLASLLIAIFLGPRTITYLRAKEFGQYIRDEGPREHHAKAGTPTMGGVVVLAAVLLPALILSDIWRVESADARVGRATILAVLGTAIGCGLIGFADDWAKIVRKRSLGLPGRYKLGGQVLISLALWWVATRHAGIDENIVIRVFDASVDVGYFYPVLIFLVLAGASNGVNLTDGLDGLAAGCSAIVFMVFTAMTWTSGQRELTLISACLAGACVGFLWFNSFPAAVFMGDTGSLGLGGAIAALAVMTDTEVLLLIIGGIFVIEALSVAIQVFSFQKFHRRVFLMAPIHHHFELLGWSETKIILRFWIVAAGFAAVGFTLFQQSIS